MYNIRTSKIVSSEQIEPAEFVIFNVLQMNFRRNVKILLPKTWTNVPNVAPIENESFETAEFR